MQPGVLEDVPKTYIGTIHEMDSTENGKDSGFLGSKISNYFILDVERTGKKSFGDCFPNDMGFQLMASLSIFAGIIVLYTWQRKGTPAEMGT